MYMSFSPVRKVFVTTIPVKKLITKKLVMISTCIVEVQTHFLQQSAEFFEQSITGWLTVARFFVLAMLFACAKRLTFKSKNLKKYLLAVHCYPMTSSLLFIYLKNKCFTLTCLASTLQPNFYYLFSQCNSLEKAITAELSNASAAAWWLNM